MKKISLLSMFAVLLSAPCFAQQVDEEVVQEGQVQSRMIVASDDGSGAAPQVFMTTSDGASIGSMVMADVHSGWAMGAPDVFSLAQNGSVQKEIELVDEQMDQLKTINSDYSKRMKDMMADMRDDKGNFDVQKAKDLGEMIKEMNEEKNARMQDVFLPHQFDRLKQISLQSQMKRSGDSSLLSNKEVVEALDMDEEQQEEIKERAKEIKKELQKDIEKLKKKARDELLEELTSDQRKKLESMLGEDFELKTPNFRDRIRRARPGNRKRTTEDK